MSFKQNLIFMMKENDLTPSQLDRRAQLAPSSVSKMLSKPHPNPTLKTLIALTNFFKCSIDHLVGFDVRDI